MYIVLIYDISTLEKKGTKTLSKMLKLCRQYLHHTQKSVFEGEISEAQLKQIKYQIKLLIDQKKDYVVIYRIDNKNNIKRENMGINFDPINNII